MVICSHCGDATSVDPCDDCWLISQEAVSRRCSHAQAVVRDVSTDLGESVVQIACLDCGQVLEINRVEDG